MLFNALKYFRLSKETNLMQEELFLLQVISDYKALSEDLDYQSVIELQELHNWYYTNFANVYAPGTAYEQPLPWKGMVEKLIEEEWIIDLRQNPNEYKLSELSVSDKFVQAFGLSHSPEELFETAKSAYPKKYLSQYNNLSPNFNMSAKDEEACFKAFKKKILTNTKRVNWFEFYYITTSLFEDKEYSELRFDRYVNSFVDNLEEYRRIVNRNLGMYSTRISANE